MFKEKSIFNIKNNKLLLIEGNDKNKFIQGIISNDIELLKKKINLLSILTPQGRFLYDFFITALDDKFLLECNSYDFQEILKNLIYTSLNLTLILKLKKIL